MLRGTMVMLTSSLWATSLAAHPHVFIDTGIEVLIDDQNRATGLRISWTYDDLYSLSLIGDRGLDADWDGQLTADEEAALAGFDMNWDPGFPGDTYALLANAPLALSRPQDWTASYAAEKITTTHVRLFDAPVPLGGEPLIVQTYDPGYYTAYRIASETVLTGGSDCRSVAYGPDLDEADEALKAALAEYSASEDLEVDFPAIGAVYSEEVRITCPAS